MAVGDHIPNGTGGVYVEAPTACPNGHSMRRNVLVGNYPCSCGTRHMVWACKTCDAQVSAPPRSAGCEGAGHP